MLGCSTASTWPLCLAFLSRKNCDTLPGTSLFSEPRGEERRKVERSGKKRREVERSGEEWRGVHLRFQEVS